MISVSSIAYKDPESKKVIAINVGDFTRFRYKQPLSNGQVRCGTIKAIKILSPDSKQSKSYRQQDKRFKRGSVLVTLTNNKSYYLDRAERITVTHTPINEQL